MEQIAKALNVTQGQISKDLKATFARHSKKPSTGRLQRRREYASARFGRRPD
jgi:hypothetical protein